MEKGNCDFTLQNYSEKENCDLLYKTTLHEWYEKEIFEELEKEKEQRVQ